MDNFGENECISDDYDLSDKNPIWKINQAQVYVDNLPETTTIEQLTNIFQAYGKIAFVKVLKHKTEARHYGFIAYENCQAATTAIEEMNGVVLDNCRIRTLFARPETQVLSSTNLYVCGLPLLYRSDQLKTLFSQFGPISETRVLNNTILAESKGVGFVHFFRAEDAQAAVESMNNANVAGMETPLIVKFARDVRKGGRRDVFLRGVGFPPVYFGEGFGDPCPSYGSQNTVCKYFLSGKCNRGHDCNFSHVIEPPRIESQMIRSLQMWGVLETAFPSPIMAVPPPRFLKPPPAPLFPIESMPLTLKNDSSTLPNGTSKTNLYVSQFPRDWTSANLENVFAKYGQIDKIRILTPPNAEKNRGVGFVHFKTEVSAQDALNGMQNFNPPNCFKPVIVKFANQGGKIIRSTNATPGACRFWVKGDCARGDHCPFRHEAATETEGASSGSAEKSNSAERSTRQCRSAEPESPRARRAEALRAYHGPLDVNSALFQALASEAFSSDEGDGEAVDSDGAEMTTGAGAGKAANGLKYKASPAAISYGRAKGSSSEISADGPISANGTSSGKGEEKTEPKSDDELAARKPHLASWRQRAKTMEAAALFSQKRRELEAELLSNLDQPFCRYVGGGAEAAPQDGAELRREQQLDDMLRGLFKESANAGGAVGGFAKPLDDFSIGSY